MFTWLEVFFVDMWALLAGIIDGNSLSAARCARPERLYPGEAAGSEGGTGRAQPETGTPTATRAGTQRHQENSREVRT